MKAKSHKELLTELSRVFNKYIRLRDSKNEYVVCCSCSRLTPLAETDAGHFFPKSTHKALEFVEMNVNGQCRSCNRNKGYNPATKEKIKIRYANFMVKKFGVNVIDQLEGLNKVFRQIKTYELVELIKKYKNKIKKFSK